MIIIYLIYLNRSVNIILKVILRFNKPFKKEKFTEKKTKIKTGDDETDLYVSCICYLKFKPLFFTKYRNRPFICLIFKSYILK